MYLYKEEFKNDTYKRKYACGILSIKFNLFSCVTDYKFLGLKFMKKVILRGCSKYNVLKIFKFKKHAKSTAFFLLPILIKYLKQKITSENFDIIPLQYRLGETMLFLYYFKSYSKKQKINNPVFVSAMPYLESLCKIFYPEIPFIEVPPFIFNIHWADIPEYTYKNIRYIQNLSRPYFIEYERNCPIEQFYAAHTKKLGVENDKIVLPKYSPDVIRSAELKMQMLGLKKPYAFIVPDARSSPTLSKYFWDKLPLELFNLGYDMYFNTIPWRVANSSYKHCYLSVAEAKFIAEHADIIIGVRCGLLDVITDKNSIVFSIFLDFVDRDDLPVLPAEKVLKAFTLKQLPNINPERIFEYNGQVEEESDILENIVNILQDIKNTEKLNCNQGAFKNEKNN